jgi:hypothetical protein
MLQFMQLILRSSLQIFFINTSIDEFVDDVSSVYDNIGLNANDIGIIEDTIDTNSVVDSNANTEVGDDNSDDDSIGVWPP